MAVAMRRWNDDLPLRHRDSWWGKDDMWLDDSKDWPMEWPQPRELMGRFTKEPDNWWKDWPSHWPRWDAVMPRVSTQLDRLDRNWRNDPFWMDIYPRWAEPIFKDGIDVQSKITNDEQRFAVDIDCYQFKPEEIQVKTLDDTLLIEGRHQDVKDRDNFTKMYFVRKYQLPQDVDITKVASSIDNRMSSPQSQFLVSQAIVPMRENCLPPSPEYQEVSLQVLLKLRGIFSPLPNHFEEMEHYINNLSSKIIRGWNSLNGAPLKLPLTLTSHTSTTFRFPSKIIRRNKENRAPNLVEYVKAKYNISLLYPNSYTVSDANGSIIPLEACHVILKVEAHPGFVSRSTIVEKEKELVKMFKNPEEVARNRKILNENELHDLTMEITARLFEKL